MSNTTTKATTLVSLANLRVWLGVTDASDDARIKFVADAVSERIESVTRRAFVTRTFTETYDGAGKSLLLLRNYPVISVASLAVKTTPTSTPIAYVNGTDYDLNSRTGAIKLRSASFVLGFQNVAITYDSGYGAQDAATLPQDVYQAALDYMKLTYNELTANAIAASSVNLGNSTFLLKPGLPWSIKSVLDSWTRRRL